MYRVCSAVVADRNRTEVPQIVVQSCAANNDAYANASMFLARLALHRSLWHLRSSARLSRAAQLQKNGTDGTCLKFQGGVDCKRGR